MKKEIKQDFFKFFIRTSKDIMQKSGHHNPQLFFVNDKTVLTFIVSFGDDDEKQKVLQKARQIFNYIKPEKYYYVSEAWSLKIDKDKKYERPSESSDRQECLIISEFLPDLSGRTCFIPVIRDGEKVLFGKINIIKSQENANLWNFYLEEEGLNEHMDSMVKDMMIKGYESELIMMAKKYKDKLSSAKNETEYNKILVDMDSEVKSFVKQVRKKIKG